MKLQENDAGWGNNGIQTKSYVWEREEDNKWKEKEFDGFQEVGKRKEIEFDKANGNFGSW